jgi:hypothetical protein
MPAAVIHRVIASRGSVVPCLTACAALVVSVAMAADDEIDPTGGLRSRTPSAPEPAPTGATREELVRRWDLDGNGTIEPSEASIARARMRRRVASGRATSPRRRLARSGRRWAAA